LNGLPPSPELVLGAATGKAMRGLDYVIESHGLEGVFITKQTADLHPSKPHPAMLEAASAQTGIAPARGIMIGDTTFDIDMAKAAGFHAIGVAWGYHDAMHLRAAGADQVAQSVAEIAPLIDEIRGTK